MASTSPRRVDLLKQAGIEFVAQAPGTDEKPIRGESPRNMVMRLAREKAESVMTAALWQHGSALILGADTTVVAPDGRTVLGKPTDKADAIRMLKKLAGKTHTVLTGYCWLSVAREIKPIRLVKVVSSKVTIRPLSKIAIERYVDTGEPMDKAGSYAAQGIGASFIEKISGSYTNVVGLPIVQVLMGPRKQVFGLIEANYQRIASEVPEGKVLVVVSKTQPADAVETLYRLGHRDFGENYVQELIAKAKELETRGCREIRWHFIGHLQSNKAKALVSFIHVVHSVDSLKLAGELAKRWKAEARSGKLPVFIEVNIDAEPSKSGVAPDETRSIAEQIAANCPELELQGLMCIPSAAATGAFTRLRELELSCRPYTRGKLSMGMTQDFKQALLEGSTHVRVGTAIFGDRVR